MRTLLMTTRRSLTVRPSATVEVPSSVQKAWRDVHAGCAGVGQHDFAQVSEHDLNHDATAHINDPDAILAT
jgi:hypothetical protein